MGRSGHTEGHAACWGATGAAVRVPGRDALNASIGFAQEYSAERTSQSLQEMVPHRCRVLRAGEPSDIPVADLVPGDVVLLESGDAVPADCRFVEAHDVTVNGADLIIAETGRDDDNLVISLLAKRQFAVSRVAARVNDGENAWMFTAHWGVDIAVPAATPLVSLSRTCDCARATKSSWYPTTRRSRTSKRPFSDRQGSGEVGFRLGGTGRARPVRVLKMPDVRVGAGKDDRYMVGVRPAHVVGRSAVLVVQADDFPVPSSGTRGRALDHELIADVCLHGPHLSVRICACSDRATTRTAGPWGEAPERKSVWSRPEVGPLGPSPQPDRLSSTAPV